MEKASKRWVIRGGNGVWQVIELFELGEMMDSNCYSEFYRFYDEQQAKTFRDLTIMKIVVLAIDGEGVAS